jgi:hypothetical protein
MKNIKDIEKLLRDTKLPDRNMSHIQHEVWHRILNMQRERHKKIFLLRIKPWIWTLASLILIVICIFIMILISRS